MINLNISDIISVISSLKVYLLVVLAVLLAMGVVSFSARHGERRLKFMIRRQAVIVSVATITVVATLICTGPMSTLLTLSTSGTAHVSSATIKKADQDITKIAGEGTVLLKNDDDALPLNHGEKLNVFGWSSLNPIYGGSGAGALNDLYKRVSLLDGLRDSGFSVNGQLESFYKHYSLKRLFGCLCGWGSLVCPAGYWRSGSLRLSRPHLSMTRAMRLSRFLYP